MKELIKIRNALEEHLAAINENTSEIQALFDYIQELDVKVEKLCQRLDTLQLKSDTKESVVPCSLNQTEKKIFLVLYTEENPLTDAEIAVKAELAESLISESLSTLILKGINLHRSFVNGQMFWKLDVAFKERQAKENLINLSLQSFLE